MPGQPLRRQWSRWAAAAVTATVSLSASACEQGEKNPDVHLDSVEVDGAAAPLSRTQLVACHRIDNDEYLFWWEGSDIQLPRRPLDNGHKSTVSIRFASDPPVVSVFNMHAMRNNQMQRLDWPDDQHEAGSIALDATGRRYLLVGHALTGGHDVRITFTC